MKTNKCGCVLCDGTADEGMGLCPPCIQELEKYEEDLYGEILAEMLEEDYQFFRQSIITGKYDEYEAVIRELGLDNGESEETVDFYSNPENIDEDGNWKDPEEQEE